MVVGTPGAPTPHGAICPATAVAGSNASVPGVSPGPGVKLALIQPVSVRTTCPGVNEPSPVTRASQ